MIVLKVIVNLPLREHIVCNLQILRYVKQVRILVLTLSHVHHPLIININLARHDLRRRHYKCLNMRGAALHNVGELALPGCRAALL